MDGLDAGQRGSEDGDVSHSTMLPTHTNPSPSEGRFVCDFKDWEIAGPTENGPALPHSMMRP